MRCVNNSIAGLLLLALITPAEAEYVFRKHVAVDIMHLDSNTLDTDSDGYADIVDNCETVANNSQADSDADGIGDACETQSEKDAYLATVLNGTPCTIDDSMYHNGTTQTYTNEASLTANVSLICPSDGDLSELSYNLVSFLDGGGLDLNASTINNSDFIRGVSSLGAVDLSNTSGFDFTAFSNLASINGNFVLTNSGLSDLTVFLNLTSMTNRDFFINNNPGITSLNGIQNMTGSGMDFDIRGTSITNFDYFPSAVTSVKSIIAENLSITSLSGLSNLSEVTSAFNIRANATLTSLDGLESLTRVGSISVGGSPGISLNLENTSVVDIYGIRNITQGSIQIPATNLTEASTLFTTKAPLASSLCSNIGSSIYVFYDDSSAADPTDAQSFMCQ